MKNHEPYDENKLAHQEPVIPISEWQEWNDAAGIESTRWEKMEQRAEERRLKRADEDEVALAQRTVY